MVVRYRGLSAYEKRLVRLAREVSRQTEDAVGEAARQTAMKAIQLAPVDTGALINNIRWKKSKSKQAWVLQRNPGNDRPNNKGQPYNYAEAMRKNNRLGNSWLRTRIRSGDPDYMEKAARWGRKEFKQNVLAHVTRAIKISR